MILGIPGLSYLIPTENALRQSNGQDYHRPISNAQSERHKWLLVNAQPPLSICQRRLRIQLV